MPSLQVFIISHRLTYTPCKSFNSTVVSLDRADEAAEQFLYEAQIQRASWQFAAQLFK